jgi:hypothetical protein
VTHRWGAGLALLLAAAPACAADVQNWSTIVAQGPIDGHLLLWTEAQSRLTNDVSHVSLLTGRVGLGVRLTHDVDLLAGYQYQHNSPSPGVASDENRFWQQLSAPVVRHDDGFALLTRWRLEERSVVDHRDLGWRLRMQWRIQQPLHGKGSGGPLLWSETFLAFNTTDWGARRGFDQQRLFAGWLQPLGHNLTVEGGYLYQYSNRRTGDVANHVLSITLNRRLG